MRVCCRVLYTMTKTYHSFLLESPNSRMMVLLLAYRILKYSFNPINVYDLMICAFIEAIVKWIINLTMSKHGHIECFLAMYSNIAPNMSTQSSKIDHAAKQLSITVYLLHNSSPMPQLPVMALK